MYCLHCFCQSGNSYQVAFLWRALAQPYQPVFVEFMQGATRIEAWLARVRSIPGRAPPLRHPAR